VQAMLAEYDHRCRPGSVGKRLTGHGFEVDAAIVDGGTAVSGADWLRVEPSELWILLNQLVDW
jgi:hypothetical protein